MKKGLTVFLGGAGMNGDYQEDMLRSLRQSGVSNVVYGNYSGWFNGDDQRLYPLVDTLSDASAVIFYNQDANDPIGLRLVNTDGCQVEGRRNGFGVTLLRYSGRNSQGRPCAKYVMRYDLDTPRSSNFSLSTIGVKCRPPEQGQFNFIGYSWGSVVAARSALYYARRQIVVDNLVLIGAPINRSLLAAVRNPKFIKKVFVVNLNLQGDPIYAGMNDDEIIRSVPTLIKQMVRENGHFYYAAESAEGKARRRVLAQKIYAKGVR